MAKGNADKKDSGLSIALGGGHGGSRTGQLER
jgi:hypothetical protein